ncbi:MBL fold metallo-hydrolase [Hippea jasoniae]|uniref:MBL fold metallo-hydrolase n=1 Tax=Hippea jasoniae TaxID=944479 RepID=UPI00068D1516|nr:MBL fold metallo-hydrolase [Hippea jasoniae]
MVLTVVVGELEENCYIFVCDATKKAAIIDPGDEAEKIDDVITKNSIKPVVIVNTHGHFDHVGANAYFKEKYDIPLAIGKNDKELLLKSHVDAMVLFGKNQPPSPAPDTLLKDGDIIEIGNEILEVIETPGHSPGSICLYNSKHNLLFSGDTLFYESVGRWDLPHSDRDALFESLQKLLKLPDNTVVYPGHGKSTTIAHERQFNPFLK